MVSRVLHLNFSSSGGAGRAAHRLADAQKEFGWSPDLLTASSSDLRTSPFEHPLHSVAAASDDFLVKKKAFSALFSLKRDDLSAISSLPTDYDVYHLHWINGLANLARESFLVQKPIVWTLHDMNPFTGGCHYTLGCENFKTDCSGCPAVNRLFRKEVTSRLANKAALYRTWPRLNVVTPSNWLAAEAARSEIFKNVSIHMIPLSLDPLFFSPPMDTVSSVGTSEKAVNIAVVAAQLDSPVKNVDSAVKAFRSAYSLVPGLRLVLIGNGGKRFRDIPGVRIAGSLSTAELIRVLDETDYLIIPSSADNSPLAAWEAAARGVIPIVNNAAGLPELIDRFKDGFIYNSASELVRLLSGGLSHSMERRGELSLRVQQLTHPSSTAEKYIELYESIR